MGTHVRIKDFKINKKKKRCEGRDISRNDDLVIMVSSNGCEEIPHTQVKEQQLRFAGAAVKRNPTSKVRETPVRW